MEQPAPDAPAPTSLYRFFDENDELLYVGITAVGLRRFRQHAKDKPWWSEVARSTVEHFEDRESAHEAEQFAIRAEGPLYNVQHAGAPPEVVTFASGITDHRATEEFVERIREMRDDLHQLVVDLDVCEGLTGTGYEQYSRAYEALEHLANAEGAWRRPSTGWYS